MRCETTSQRRRLPIALVGSPWSVFKRTDDSIDSCFALREMRIRIHNEIGTAAFFCVGCLARENVLEAIRRHVRTRQHAGALRVGIRGNDDHLVEGFVQAGLEEKRDLENGERSAGFLLRFDEGDFTAAYERVDDRFKALETCGIFRESGSEFSRGRCGHRLKCLETLSRRAERLRPHRDGCTSASASKTGKPRDRNIAAIVDLPMPIEP